MSEQPPARPLAPPTRCRLCGAIACAPRFRVREMMFGTREEFAYDECTACESLQLARIPDDLARHYPPGYYAHGESVADAANALRRFRRAMVLRFLLGAPTVLLRLMERMPRIGVALATHPLRALRGRLTRGLTRGRALRVADVGGGDGRLLRGLVRARFPLEAPVVIDPYLAADSIREGVHFRRARLADVDGQFDIISYHHAFEHVAEPAAELQAIRAHLSPDGIALIRVPWVPSHALATYGADWVQLDAPRHVTLPSRAGLCTAAARAGLECLAQGDDSTEFQFWGSEAYHAGFSLAAGAQRFTRLQRRQWRADARRLNAESRGDQGWVLLTPAVGP